MAYLRRFFIVFIIFTSLIAGFFNFSQVSAQTPRPQPTQSQAECYSQCGFYKFYWKGDFCYDMVQLNCTESFNLKDVVSMVKSIRKSFLTGKLKQIVDVTPIFKAWLICKPLIEDCIVPQLDDCASYCQTNTVGYAPNLSVGSDWGSFHGLFYSDERKTLNMKVINNGLGYASDIGVTMSYGYTANQDGTGMTGSVYLSETIPELLFLGSRQAAPKGVGDIVTDFLIDESNFASYLQGFKSDADNYYIPPGWEKTISFSAPEGKLTRIILNVDPNQDIVESNENDNTYILDIDKRPTPARFEITNIEVIRQGNTLTDYMVKITVENTGDLEGSATLSFIEGGDAGGNPEGSVSKSVGSHATTVFEVNKSVDVTNGYWTCVKAKIFTAIVKDDSGASTRRQFEIPLYAGHISGRVTDMKGKSVAGATVTASTGQTTTTSSYGFYHLNGFTNLGEINLTFSHKNYTGKVTKPVTFTFDKDTAKPWSCDIKGLNQTSVDAVLRDTPLKLTVKLKSSTGILLDGQVILSGGAGSFTYEVPGEKLIEEMEPGQFRVTAGAPSYITKEIQTVLTPPEQTLEIVLEKLNGRETDEGLLIINPVKIWEKNIDTGIINTLAGAKNGKLLVVNTADSSNKSGGINSWTGKLTFINPVDGMIIRSAPVPFNVGQSRAAIDASYDGRTVGFTYSIQDSEVKTKSHTFVKAFNAIGNELGTLDLGVSRSVMMEVSPDGYYLYPHQLINASLYQYTRKEIEGVGDGRDHQSYMANQTLHFLRNNKIIAGCKEGQCVININDTVNRVLGKVDKVARLIDSNNDGSAIVIRTDDTIKLFGSPGWEKELPGNPHFESAGITPGSEYVIATTGGNGSEKLKIFDRSGVDITPDFDYKNVRLVEANDRGMFFSVVRSNKITYYQIGKYTTEYNPPEEIQEEETVTSDLEQYSGGEFKPLNPKSWDQLDLYGGLLRAKKRLTLKTSWGSMTVGEGTIFAKNHLSQPMLFWGSMEIDAETPQIVLVFKFKEYDVSKFNFVLNLYRGDQPLEGGYVTVTNLHTRYEIKAGKRGVLVLVNNGSVSVETGENKIEVKQGQLAQINENDIKVGANWIQYTGWVITIFLIAGCLLIFWKIKSKVIRLLKLLIKQIKEFKREKK